jgi:hypothetical protein
VAAEHTKGKIAAGRHCTMLVCPGVPSKIAKASVESKFIG